MSDYGEAARVIELLGAMCESDDPEARDNMNAEIRTILATIGMRQLAPLERTLLTDTRDVLGARLGKPPVGGSLH